MTETPIIDQIDLTEADEYTGYSHWLSLGGDGDRGWTLEFCMEGGKFTGQFTPAGTDTAFIMVAEELGEDRRQRIEIHAETNIVVWDAVDRVLYLADDPADIPPPNGEALALAAPAMLLALKSLERKLVGWGIKIPNPDGYDLCPILIDEVRKAIALAEPQKPAEERPLSRFRVRLEADVTDTLATYVEVDATDGDAAAEAALKQARENLVRHAWDASYVPPINADDISIDYVEEIKPA